MKHLVLVGGMGVGKSTVGRVLSGRLGRPLRDSDSDLHDECGVTGRELADRAGVGALHRMEARILFDAVASAIPSIVAAAASVVDDERCLRALRSCDVVWLRAGLETMSRRIAGVTHRRLVETGSLAALTDARQARYQSVADLTLDTDDVSPEELADAIVDWV